MRFILAAFAILFGLGSEAFAQGIADGTYQGTRGYYNPSYPYCHGTYSFQATVENGIISFESDGHYWEGTIDMATGQVHIPYAGVTPPYKDPVSIVGHYSNGRLYSGYCGEGYFRLD